MHPTIWSILPFAIVIPVSILTRQVIPGLLLGLLAGSFMIAPGLLQGIDAALAYLYKELALPGNLHLLVFLYLFGALVGLVRVTGGVSGFAKWIEPRIRSARAAYALTWVSSLATFMAPDFRIITVAPIMRSIMKRVQIAPEDIAYAIDVTATPLISLIPVGTAFVGYMVGLIAVALKHVGHPAPPYPFFLATIPLNFFAIAILGIGLYLSFFRGEKGVRDGRASSFLRRAGAFQHAHNLQVEVGQVDPEPLDIMSERAAPSTANLLVPIGLLLLLTLFLTWWNGHAVGRSFLGALIAADAAKAMLQAIMITLLAAGIFYLIRRQSISRLMTGIVAGGNEMIPVIILLILVWAVSGVSADLGFSKYIGARLGAVIPRMLIAPALFVLGSLISYFIGSSFGTWGILMPLGFSLASSTHASLLLIAGAVFASGTLGGFASPLSDNTVAMAAVMKIPVMEFARSLLKTTLLAGGIATVGYTIAGFAM